MAAPGARYPARGRGRSTHHQGTPPAADVNVNANANELISSESIVSSTSPASRRTSLLSDTPDRRTTAPHAHTHTHMNPAHAAHRAHSVPRSAALSSRSPSSSIQRAHDMDHHHHPHHPHQHHHGRERPSTLQRVATGFRRLTRAADVPAVSEEDWSVFGEAMAHEGVQPQPQSQPSAPPGVVPVPTSQVLLVSSPVSDDHLEDFISSVEGGGARSVREGEEQDEEEEGRSSLERRLRVSSLSLSRSRSRSHRSHVGARPSSLSDTESTSLGVSSEDSDTDLQGQHLRGGSKGRSSSSWWTRKRLLQHLPTLPVLYRNILKCSIAYFLGSLFTYYPPLSRFISELTQDGPGEKYPSAMGHMVATVAVYYNPAKTLGGMIESDIYCVMGLGFASFISLGSMHVYWTLEPHAGWEWLADALVLIWIGVGMSMVAWFKLWIAKPTFNPAASMTSIILFVVVVKEGGIETLLQVALIVAIGACISNLVCMTLWSRSAKKNLQVNMIKTLDSFSTILSLLTSTFLLEDESYQPSQEKISKAVAAHQATFTGLKKSLAEAQSERLYGGPNGGRGGDPYEDAVDSLTRLAQHLNGLRSGTSLQYDLVKEHRDSKVAIRRHSALGGNMSRNALETDHAKVAPDGPGAGDAENVMLRAAAAMFGDLVGELDSPLRALSSTCTKAIRHLRGTFSDQGSSSADVDSVLDEFIELTNGIRRALFEFDSTSNHAVLRLYNRVDAQGPTSLASNASASTDNNSGPFLSGSDNEHVFLVYFFIFAMQEFARELISLTVAMSRIYAAERPDISSRWLPRISAALSGAFCCLRSRIEPPMPESQSRRTDVPVTSKPARRGLHRRLSGILTKEKSRITYSFPKVRPHAPDTVQTPSRAGLSAWRRFQLSLWAIGGRLQDHDVKYALKTGLATAVLAAPAFIDRTRPMFMEYRGEWALISFFVVMSPTIGATNFLSVHRVLGTLFGAVTAATAYTLFHKTPAILAVFGFLFSMPCFYYIVAKPQYATTGRFVLLTYNLTCLFSYNTRQFNKSVVDIAFHRSTAVTVGVVWAGFVSRFWWPSEARRELSKQLGEFCLNIGWLYTRLVASNSFLPENPTDASVVESESPNEETPLLPRRMNNSVEEFMAMELHLQIKLLELQDLLKQTQHEPRLKGPFPIKLYRSILGSLQTILDKLHSMRCVTTREEWYTSVRREFIIPVTKERREMVGNIILYFSTLASAFRLKAPLPPYLPPAEKARQQLVEAIRRLEVVRKREIKGSRQLLYFAYALTMKGITGELEFLGRTSQDAFGVIGESTEVFENMFRDNAGAV